jgi:hypothetical protein
MKLIAVYMRPLVEMMGCRKINPPGNTTRFLTEIGLPIRQYHPLEGAGLAICSFIKKSPYN